MSHLESEGEGEGYESFSDAERTTERQRRAAYVQKKQRSAQLAEFKRLVISSSHLTTSRRCISRHLVIASHGISSLHLTGS